MKWIEGSIISYLYGGISSSLLTARIHKAVTGYGVGRNDVLRLIESVEERYETYFGGRYRLAFAVITNKPNVAPFRRESERAKLIASLREVVKSSS